MYIQVITYSLQGIDEADYLDVANHLAGRIAGVPGLLAKIWLENEGGNRYGGIYFWDDLESMQRFGQSDLFEGRVPEFAESVVEEFGVLENLTTLTQPILEILKPRRGPAAPAAGAGSRRSANARAEAATAHPPRKRTPVPRKAATVGGATATAKRAPAKKASATKAPAKKASKKATGRS
jgi:heme-degrading monooxygenase HmoA